MTDLLREQLQAALGGVYTLERQLGSGGMARVYLAEETAFGRRFVVKLLSPELAAWRKRITRLERGNRGER